MHVAIPHEMFLAFESESFPWEGKIITDFNKLLPKIREIYSKEEIK